jgi:hypothetical protein
MARYGRAVVDEAEWIDVCPAQPCAVCGGLDGCRSMRSDDFAWCQVHASEWPLVVGGWLHRIDARVEGAVST